MVGTTSQIDHPTHRVTSFRLNVNSLDKVKQWVTELRKIVGTNISLVIAGNKIDLEKKRQVDQKAAAGFALALVDTAGDEDLR